MKTFNKLFIAAAASIAMTACNNELGEQQANNNGIINFRMGIGTPASSRIAMADDNYSATFAAGDEVGIFVKDITSYTNLNYTTSDGTNWDGGPINASGKGTYNYTFYAYSPYNANNNDASNITTTVESDQETNGYIKNDFLISTAQTSNTTVNLEFDHALSLVEVKLTGKGAEGTGTPTVSMLNVATDATINLTEYTVATGTTKANVTMDALTGVPMKYRAIVPEQEILANTPIFEIVANGVKYEASFKSNTKFEKGKYLAMIITLGEGGTADIEITTGATINDWTEGNGGDVSVEEVPLILPLGDVLTDVISAPTSLTEDTWFGLKQNDSTPGVEYSIVDDASTENGKAICLKYTSTWDFDYNNGEDKAPGKKFTDSWYVGAIGYYHYSIEAPMEKGIYKVTLKIKGAKDSNGDMSKLVFTCRNATNNASFAISTSTSEDTFKATTVTKTPSKEDTWEDLVLYINFAKKSTSAPGSSVEITESVDADLTKFDLRVYTNNPVKTTPEDEDVTNTATIHIADVAMEPYVAE